MLERKFNHKLRMATSVPERTKSYFFLPRAFVGICHKEKKTVPCLRLKMNGF
jgi:hypothetical protein